MLFLTGFHAFKNRPCNGSETWVRFLDQQVLSQQVLSQKVTATSIQIFPVLWEILHAPILQDWWAKSISTMQSLPSDEPIWILSFGEGRPNRIALECRARNACHGADVAGLYPHTNPNPNESMLDSNGPPYRYTAFAARSYPANQAEQPNQTEHTSQAEHTKQIHWPIVYSEDAGRYLCNALMYTILGLIASLKQSHPELHPRIRYGFIHLPPQEEMDGGEYVNAIAAQLSVDWFGLQRG